MLDFIPYYTFYLLVYLSLNTSKRSKNIMAVNLILIIFSACRFNVGHDYPSYFNSVLDPYNSDWLRFEFIPKTLVTIAHYFNSPFIFFLLTSTIINSIILKTIKQYSPYIYISIISYVCLPFFYIENLCIVRQAIAIAFVFWGACNYIYDYNYKKFILAIILAYLSHSSSILSILLFFPYNKIKWKYHLFLLIACIFLGASLQTYLFNIDLSVIFGNDYYSSYFQEQDGTDGGKMTLVYAVFAFINIFTMKQLSTDTNTAYYKCMSIVKAGFCILFVLNFNPMLSFRLSRYFTILLLMTIPYYRYMLKIRFNYRSIVTICFFILFSLQLIISKRAYDGGKGSKSYVPYQFYFFENTNVQIK